MLRILKNKIKRFNKDIFLNIIKNERDKSFIFLFYLDFYLFPYITTYSQIYLTFLMILKSLLGFVPSYQTYLPIYVYLSCSNEVDRLYQDKIMSPKFRHFISMFKIV